MPPVNLTYRVYPGEDLQRFCASATINSPLPPSAPTMESGVATGESTVEAAKLTSQLFLTQIDKTSVP